tara:strand:- start:8037 stop:8228 length:192 start_codon:yes stop_codon:yes gene_type:complete
MWKTIKEEKPKHDQVILIRCKKSKFPEVGIWNDFEDHKSEVYIPANDDVEMIGNIDKWMPIPQ